MSERSRNILLVASLALNVFIAGGVIGGGYIWHTFGYSWTKENRRGVRFAAEYLTPEQQKALRQNLAAARKDNIPLADAGRASRAEIAWLLAQDVIDPAAVNAELTRAREADFALRTRIEQTIVAFAESLSPEDRKTLVEGLKKRNVILRQTPAKKQ
ncbi:putative membrane protein [Phyllobacterium myrsinacearum]|uniref:periplasmic heavy metal sensor n=1 Tax=Phyllobacterium myrsinacearum TaxID=28101 RepID=UPI00102891E0|nr:periplasmic heavy metal sensor [Phyllobacterium myrsinacearum]RZS82152.1 putative membrane protein [Phyllobacterium myrsinacearum]